MWNRLHTIRTPSLHVRKTCKQLSRSPDEFHLECLFYFRVFCSGYDFTALRSSWTYLGYLGDWLCFSVQWRLLWRNAHKLWFVNKRVVVKCHIIPRCFLYTDFCVAFDDCDIMLYNWYNTFIWVKPVNRSPHNVGCQFWMTAVVVWLGKPTVKVSCLLIFRKLYPPWKLAKDYRVTFAIFRENSRQVNARFRYIRQVSSIIRFPRSTSTCPILIPR